MDEIENNKSPLFSKRAISIATFFGGPIAAAYLLRKNYKALNYEAYAQQALRIGIVATLLFYILIFSLDEVILDSRFPNIVLPAVIMGIVYWITDKTIGSELEEHKQSGGSFYSAWNAVGVGLVSAFITFAVIIGAIFLTDANAGSGNNGIIKALERFDQQEQKALLVYDMIEDEGKNKKALNYIDSISIPLWRKNMKLIDSVSMLEGTEADLQVFIKHLQNYTRIRIQEQRALKEAISNMSDPVAYERWETYSNSIDSLNRILE